jgi:hypothetical protein
VYTCRNADRRQVCRGTRAGRTNALSANVVFRRADVPPPKHRKVATTGMPHFAPTAVRGGGQVALHRT